MRKKRFLTLFWNASPKEILYKDVEGIPYALSKYLGWEATYAYSDSLYKIEDKKYERYVNLQQIGYPSWVKNKSSKLLKKIKAIQYVVCNAAKYDVLQLYHYNYFNRFLCRLAQYINPSIITYIKLDMGRGVFDREKRKSDRYFLEKLFGTPTLFTVEAKQYVDELNNTSKYKGRVKYLPNGFFEDLVPLYECKKENIILTVGRLGTYQKNTELLVEAFLEIDSVLSGQWKLYLVGGMTEEFRNWLERKMQQYPGIKDRIVVTGHIGNKENLYNIYARAKIFVLPSRMESWGLVLNEAMYFRNYVIATDCCDAYYDFLINKEKPIASIVPNDNKEDLIKELETVIVNEDKYMELASEGAKYISESFNWKVIVKNLEVYFTMKG